MKTDDIDVPEEINVHKQNWGKNADQVIYGREGVGSGETEEDDKLYRCPFCRSRIDEYGYCACGGNLGID